jgi:outer membrane protein OmpA-like peptidoglycan-associated protein
MKPPNINWCKASLFSFSSILKLFFTKFAFSLALSILSSAEFKVGEKMTLKNIGFYGNSPEFLPRYKETLDQLAADLLKNKSYYVEIQGHIYDERNYSDKHTIYTNYPPTLSEDRAKTIYDYLIKSGVDSTRLSYVGFQGKFPLYKNPQDDRRVEIEVVKIQPE